MDSMIFYKFWTSSRKLYMKKPDIILLRQKEELEEANNVCFINLRLPSN